MPFGVVSILSPWCDAAFLHSQDPERTSPAAARTRIRSFERPGVRRLKLAEVRVKRRLTKKSAPSDAGNSETTFNAW
jgi:hypothetical protein